MRASRLLSILILLQMRGRMSASQLADEFEVSIRTIHRDIDALSASGVPVYAERGRSGGFLLHEGYRTRLTGLTAQEAEFLLLAGLGSVAADLGVAPELAAGQLKLAASLPQGQGERAKAMSERFHFDPVPWYQPPERTAVLPYVAEAVWRGKRLTFAYESWSADVERIADPLGLVLKAGLWYMIAAIDGTARTYRISNIRHATMMEEDSARPPRFNLPGYWKQRVKDFEASLLKGEATVRLTARGAAMLSSLNAAAAVAMSVARTTETSDWIEAVVPVESENQAAALFLRLGNEVEILAPETLREKLAVEGRRLVQLYGEEPSQAVSSAASNA